jgi:thiol-disulfide isomerase/thioredoxin
MRNYLIAALYIICAAWLSADEIDSAWLEGNTQLRERLKNLAGKPAPALQVKDWKQSEPLKLAELKGKVVVLDFWATWCGPCLRSIGHNNAIAEKYGDQVVFIGVCHPRGSKKADQVIKTYKIKYPVAIDADGDTIETYKVNGFPYYYIIDQEGRLVAPDTANGSVTNVIEVLLKSASPKDS